MESPFFRSHWNYPRRPRYVPSMMEVPVQRRTVPVPPKVVSIPVRFVESEKSRSVSATKIQKVFRGFLVRKSVKKVVAIEGEVNEIERRLENEETVELIRRDTKERLKFGEMLMSLLFRLDSVKGVDSGIRNFRKAVIKKAIALQEKVDLIVAADEGTGVVDETPDVGNAECDSEAVDPSSEMNAAGARESSMDETPELEDGIPEHENESPAADIPNTCDLLEAQLDSCDGNKRGVESADACNELENVDEEESRLRSIEHEGAIMEKSTPSFSSDPNVVPEISAVGDDLLKPQISENDVNSPHEVTGKDVLDETVAELRVPEEFDDNDMVHRETEAAEEYAAMSEAESQTDSSNNPPNSDKGVAEYVAVDEREGGGNEEDRIEEEEEDSRAKGREGDEQSRELLEKMTVDNKKMMEMMAQLFEKNEMQTRLLCSLSHRVEQLERAFVYETLRRKKRSGTIVDSSEKCPKTKKCGK